MQTPQELIADIKKVIDTALYDRGVRMPYVTAIDSAYTGGAPKTKDGGDSAAPDATDLLIMPCPISPSDQVVKLPLVGGGFGILGKLETPPPGLLNVGACWQFITPGSIAISSTAITGRAQKLYNNQYLTIASVMFEITAGGGGLNAQVRLYSSNGVLVLDTGLISAATSTIKTAVISPAVRIIPGTYIARITADVGVSWRCADLMANIAAIMNTGTVQRATDETMVTGVTNVQFPGLKFAA